MKLSELTWEEFASLDKERLVAVFPVGSTEQHGLHIPLGTDTIIAEFLENAVHQNPHALVLPVLPIGISDVHKDFPGSLWITPETMKYYIGDTLRALSSQGIHTCIFVNGHGGNRNTLYEFCRDTASNHGVRCFVFNWFESIGDTLNALFHPNVLLHASEVETSMLAVIDPTYIRYEKIDASADGASQTWQKKFNGTIISQQIRDFSKSGATGDPRNWDESKGRLTLNRAVTALLDLIDFVVERSY